MPPDPQNGESYEYQGEPVTVVFRGRNRICIAFPNGNLALVQARSLKGDSPTRVVSVALTDGGIAISQAAERGPMKTIVIREEQFGEIEDEIQNYRDSGPQFSC